jgi:PAS domain S-box-containing protein
MPLEVYDMKLAQQALLERFAPPAVAVDGQLDIYYRSGAVHRFLVHSHGPEAGNLLDCLPEDLHAALHDAASRALRENVCVPLRTAMCSDRDRSIQLSVSRIDGADNHLLVTFSEIDDTAATTRPEEGAAGMDATAARLLEQELSTVRENNRRNVEKLISFNEELQASNEELEVSNEELRAAKMEVEKSREELWESERRLRLVLDNSRDGVHLLELRTNTYAFMSPSHEQLTGFLREELNVNIVEAERRVHPEDVDIVNDYLRRVMEGAEPCEPMEYRWKVKSGEYRWFSDSRRAVRDRKGYVVGIVGITRDITERKRTENELLRERKLLQAIYDTIPAMLAVYDPEQSAFTLNKAIERVTGWSPQDCEKTSIMELAYPDAAYRQEVADYMNSLQPGFKDITMMTKRGEPITTSWANTELADGRRVGVGIDISQRKGLEQQLRRNAEQLAAANRELEAFSYSVSHDLRAPLRAMSGFSGFLLEDYADRLDEEGQDYLHRIVAGAEKMNTLIEDMLRLSRISRQEMVLQDIDLSDMAAAIVKDLQHQQPDRRVEIVIAPDLHARGDTRTLDFALNNLLGNAWKYTGKAEQPRIEFGAAEKEGERVFFIRDNGAGFSMKQAGKLFTPFQRLHTESEFPGTGIGLAIVQRVINRHGGRIWAESGVGEGATFYFTLG